MIATIQEQPHVSSAKETCLLLGRRIHFMGAGGIGVSALMELARARGALVTGCDGSCGGQVPHLRDMGIDVHAGHDTAHVDTCDELVFSAAVPESHPEIQRARELGVEVTPRMAFLGRLARGVRPVCVTGTHGKTTTTWMIAQLLIHAGRDPSVLVGGVAPSLQGNVRIPRGRAGSTRGEFVVEVDESDNRLGEVRPALAVVTNIDNDHLDRYGSMENIQAAIANWLCHTVESDPLAACIGCGDDARVLAAMEEALGRTGLPFFDYGFDTARAVRAARVQLNGLSATFDAIGPFGAWRDLELPMPGRHNVMNALAAITAAWRLGLDEQTVRTGLAGMERVGRRFEIKGAARGVHVVDDYGHHPTEIAATLQAARDVAQGRVGVFFQPHRYTRTSTLMDDFAKCFAASGAEMIAVLPVYAASEKSIRGATHKTLVQRIEKLGFSNVKAVKDRAEGVALLAAWAKEGDLILTQGAGDVTLASHELLDVLRANQV